MKFLLYKGIFLGFLFNFIVLLALGWVAYKRAQLTNELQQLDLRKDEVSLSVEKVLSGLAKAQNAAKGYALTKNEAYISHYNSSVYDLQQDLRNLEALFEENPAQRELAIRLRQLSDKRLQYHSDLTGLVKYKTFEEAKHAFMIKQDIELSDNFELTSEQLKLKELGYFAKESIRRHREKDVLDAAFPILFVVSLLLLVTVFFIIRYHLRGRIKAETLLEGNEQAVKSIIDRTTEPIFLKEIGGEYILANKQFESLFFGGQEFIKGKTDEDIFPKELADRMRATDLDVIKAEKELRFEEILPHNGEERTYIIVKFPLRDLKNKVYGVGAIATDITEHKYTEARLQESQALIQTFFDIAPEAVIMIDEESKILKWNRKAEQIFKWSPEEVLNKPVYEVIMPERYKDAHIRGMQHFLSTGEGPVLDRTIEISAIRRDKSEFEAELSISASKVKEKYIFVAFMKDITGRKKLERENQENKNFLSSVIENIPDMIFVKDANDLHFVTLNKAGEKLLGYSKSEVVGKSDFDFFPKQQAEFFVAKDREVLSGKTLVDIKEEEIETKDGKRWLHTKKMPIMDENGKPKYLLGISSDITKRKKLETERDEAARKLRDNEKRISLILENIGEGVVVADHKKRIVLLNQMAEEILELHSDAEAVDWTQQYDIFYSDGRVVFPAQNLPLERALRGEKTDEEEIVLRDPERRVTKRLKVTGRPIFDDRGNVRAAVATIKDVTKFKEMERALEESELKYRRLIGFQRGSGDADKNKSNNDNSEKKEAP